MAKITKISRSPRLSALFEQCLNSGPIWDLCCDHGLIGFHACLLGREVIFVDSSKNIIELLQQKFRQKYAPNLELEIKPKFFSQDVLNLNFPISGSIILAGIGGYLMVRLVESLLPKLDGKWRLILCANNNQKLLHQYLQQQEFLLQVVKCVNVTERSRPREIMVVEAKG